MPEIWKQNWSPEEETAFRAWYAKWSKWLGLNPDPDDPKHYYDYREAFARGLEPSWQEEHQQYRWPDIGKSKNYPYE